MLNLGFVAFAEGPVEPGLHSHTDLQSQRLSDAGIVWAAPVKLLLTQQRQTHTDYRITW